MRNNEALSNDKEQLLGEIDRIKNEKDQLAQDYESLSKDAERLRNHTCPSPSTGGSPIPGPAPRRLQNQYRRTLYQRTLYQRTLYQRTRTNGPCTTDPVPTDPVPTDPVPTDPVTYGSIPGDPTPETANTHASLLQVTGNRQSRQRHLHEPAACRSRLPVIRHRLNQHRSEARARRSGGEDGGGGSTTGQCRYNR